MLFQSRISALVLFCLGIAACGLSGAPAQAQEGGIQASSELEEVVVTARRREESLQDTPISIAAFSGETLERQHIDQLNGIAAFTPNLTFDSGATFSGTSSSASVFIRGIGQVDFTLTTEPGVGIYLDGVYLSQTIGSVLDLVDIDHVEVLRGPQGTLFGRNIVGGAINVITTKPRPEPAVFGLVRANSFDGVETRTTLNTPIPGSNEKLLAPPA